MMMMAWEDNERRTEHDEMTRLRQQWAGRGREGVDHTRGHPVRHLWINIRRPSNPEESKRARVVWISEGYVIVKGKRGFHEIKNKKNIEKQ